jgi:hypothetical protein
MNEVLYDWYMKIEHWPLFIRIQDSKSWLKRVANHDNNKEIWNLI